MGLLSERVCQGMVKRLRGQWILVSGLLVKDGRAGHLVGWKRKGVSVYRNKVWGRTWEWRETEQNTASWCKAVLDWILKTRYYGMGCVCVCVIALQNGGSLVPEEHWGAKSQETWRCVGRYF